MSNNSLNYTLGIDMGSGSIGWALLNLGDDGEPCGVIRTGSRIFGAGRKPKDNASLAVDRRDARSARRRRDRYIRRRKVTLNRLAKFGLMPTNLKERDELKKLDPFYLRHRGLTEKLSPYEIGRALYHLQQRRGFQSNRKTDKQDEKELGTMKQAIYDFGNTIGPDETVGSVLWQRMKSGQSARARLRGKGRDARYDFYYDRDLIKDEFEKLWESQARFHPDLLTAEAKEKIFDAIFYQRPLKEVDPGKCLYEDGELRAKYSLESSQLFRLYQEVNALRVRDLRDPKLSVRGLTRVEREKAINYLQRYKDRTFEQLRKELFGRAGAEEFRFTHEEGERKKILGNAVAALLAHKNAFGPAWFDVSVAERDAICQAIDQLESESDENQLRFDLIENYGLAEENATFVAKKINLPDGHLRLSTKAVSKILPQLESWDEESDSALVYSSAVMAAGYRSHSDFHGEVQYEELPYYGEVLSSSTQDVKAGGDSVASDEAKFGRIANPTVHIALNQLRKLVNEIVRVYGKPTRIHIELARDLAMSKEDRNRASSERARNEKNNAELDRILREEFGIASPKFADRLKLKLYNELSGVNHSCVLCGKGIERGNLLTNAYQVDHILPFSRTLDDSYLNKMLVCLRCNQNKGNRSPFEAFGNSEAWGAINDRAEAAFTATAIKKLERFAADAMDKYTNGETDFIARQLNDTRYMARVAKKYLSYLIDPDQIITSPGRMTATLRHHWGLNNILSDGNTKNRHDHRHHAIDAVVVACTNRKTINAINRGHSHANSEGSVNGVNKAISQIDEPWPTFREDVARAIDRTVASHKPDHAPEGQLHEDTAYGIKEKRKTASGEYEYLSRTRKRDENGNRLPSEYKWRPLVAIYRRGESPDSAKPFKGYIGGSNHCIEIVRRSDGRWDGRVISTFQANQNEYREFMKSKEYFKFAFSGEELVMRLHANDSIAIEEGGERKIMRMYKVKSNGQAFFAPINEGNIDSRVSTNEIRPLIKNANPLKALKARRVFVDILGRVKDPGFRE